MREESDEQEILRDRLGRLGAEGGKFGAEVSDQLGLSDVDGQTAARVAAAGGRRGARIGARLTGDNVHDLDLTLSRAPAEAADLARAVLRDLGELLDAADGSGPPGAVWGVVGAGYFNLNPAVITVTVAADASGSRVHVRGVAKEGLIKQHAGRKAAERVAAELKRRALSSTTS